MKLKNKTIQISQSQITHALDHNGLHSPSKCPMALAIKAAGFAGALVARWGITLPAAKNSWMPCTAEMKQFLDDFEILKARPMEFETDWRPRRRE